MLTRSCLKRAGSVLDRSEHVGSRPTRWKDLNAPVVCRGLLQRTESSSTCYPEALDDSLWMDLLRNKFLCLPQQLRRQHANTRRPVSDLIVLDFGDVYKDLSGSIVKLNRLEDGCTIVRHVDITRRSGLKDLVHALGTERGFDEISEGECADEGRETRILSLFLCRLR